MCAVYFMVIYNVYVYFHVHYISGGHIIRGNKQKFALIKSTRVFFQIIMVSEQSIGVIYSC